MPHVKRYVLAASKVFFEPKYPKNWSTRNIIGQELSGLFAGQTDSVEAVIDNIDTELRQLIQ